MSSLGIAGLLVGFIAAICFLLINIHKKHTREAMNKMLKRFSQLATENNLSFSSQEILKDSVIGLDGIQRKILVLITEDDDYSWLIIDLHEVKSCSVKKVFGTINVGDLKDQKLEQFLEKIVLHFEQHRKPPVEIVFYKNISNHIYQMQELEQKAKHWETVLYKMITPAKNIA